MVGKRREAKRRQTEAEQGACLAGRVTSRPIWRRSLPQAPSNFLGSGARSPRCLPISPAFTSLVETLDPAVIAPLLNDYLGGHDRYRVCPWRHGGKDHRRRHACAVRARRQINPTMPPRSVACALELDVYSEAFRPALGGARRSAGA